jgi:hypothetical protein
MELQQGFDFLTSPAKKQVTESSPGLGLSSINQWHPCSRMDQTATQERISPVMRMAVFSWLCE